MAMLVILIPLLHRILLFAFNRMAIHVSFHIVVLFLTFVHGCSDENSNHKFPINGSLFTDVSLSEWGAKSSNPVLMDDIEAPWTEQLCFVSQQDGDLERDLPIHAGKLSPSRFQHFFSFLSRNMFMIQSFLMQRNQLSSY